MGFTDVDFAVARSIVQQGPHHESDCLDPKPYRGTPLMRNSTPSQDDQ